MSGHCRFKKKKKLCVLFNENSNILNMNYISKACVVCYRHFSEFDITNHNVLEKEQDD